MKKEDEMKYLNQPEYEINFMEWDPALCFKTEEACQLLHFEVIRAEDSDSLPSPPYDKVGLVVGVIVMNEEVEILVKFLTGIEQLVKTEFCGDYIIVPDQ